MGGGSCQSYRDRLEMEADVIIKMGFSGYFLIVQDCAPATHLRDREAVSDRVGQLQEEQRSAS